MGIISIKAFVEPLLGIAAKEKCYMSMLNWFNSLKIGQKVSLGYGLTIGAMVVGIGAGYKIASLHQHQANVLMEDALEELLLLNDLENNILLVRNGKLSIFPPLSSRKVDSTELSELLNHLKEIEKTWSKFNVDHGNVNVDAPGESLEEKKATDNLVKKYEELEPWLWELEKILTAEENRGIVSDRIGEKSFSQIRETSKYSRKAFNEFIEAIEELKRLVVVEHNEAQVKSEEADTWQLSIIMASLLLSIVLASGLAWSIIQSVVMPLQKVTQVAQEVTQSGKFEKQIPVNSSDEIGLLASALNQLIREVNSLVKKQREANEKLADYNQNLEKKVEERTKELSHTLRQLQTAQVEIIQAEKMAALGHLVAGIAHEINTPLGAIQASISNISSSLDQSLQQLPELFQQLSREQLKAFCLLLSWATQRKEILSSREERQLRGKLKQILREQEIEEAEQLGDLLSRMNIMESLDPIFPILSNKSALFMVNCAYQLASIRNNSKNISLATERAGKIVFALKTYLHQDSLDKMQEVPVSESLDLILTLYQNQIKRGIEVRKNYESVRPILCYVEELTQVWSNLIGNAIQAMNYQGDLKIQIQEEDNYLVVEIEDSGSGIDEEIKEKIFEPFFTTKAPGEGSGLGLHIVKQIIDKHQGQIEFSSQNGHTTFRVFLPLSRSYN